MSREPVAGFMRVGAAGEHYPGLRIDVFEIAAAYIGPDFRVTVELTSGQAHVVTPPLADYGTAERALDVFEGEVAELRRQAVRSGTR